MRKIDINELKQIQLEMMDHVHAFCMEHQIRYSLCGGTLLGAVRHKGYIPWDDDIDIMMLRQDFERFKSSYHREGYTLMDLSDNPNCVELFFKLSKDGTRMTDRLLGRSMWGINIDIFPIDGYPEASRLFWDEIIEMRERLARICPYYKVATRNRLRWMLKYFVKRVISFYPHSSLYLKKQIVSRVVSFNAHPKMRSSILCGGHYSEVIPAEVFEKYRVFDFEGRQYLGVEDNDQYLKSKFGDYMKLPPKQERVLLHKYDVYVEA